MSQDDKELVDSLKHNIFIHVPRQLLCKLEEAEELLIKVCEHIEQWPVSHAKYIINEKEGVKRIEGLKEWWTKHKPKSERDKKLEKIKAVINKSGTYCVDDRCEEILKALEE